MSEPRQTLDTLSEEQINEILEGLRDRRMRALRQYESAVALREAVLIERHKKALEQHIRMFGKEHASADKAIEKLEVRALKLTALRREIEYALEAAGTSASTDIRQPGTDTQSSASTDTQPKGTNER